MQLQCFKSQVLNKDLIREDPSTPVWREPGSAPQTLTYRGQLGKGLVTHQTLGGQFWELVHHAVRVIQGRNTAEGRRRQAPTMSTGWWLAPGFPISLVGMEAGNYLVCTALVSQL